MALTIATIMAVKSIFVNTSKPWLNKVFQSQRGPVRFAADLLPSSGKLLQLAALMRASLSEVVNYTQGGEGFCHISWFSVFGNIKQ